MEKTAIVTDYLHYIKLTLCYASSFSVYLINSSILIPYIDVLNLYFIIDMYECNVLTVPRLRQMSDINVCLFIDVRLNEFFVHVMWFYTINKSNQKEWMGKREIYYKEKIGVQKIHYRSTEIVYSILFYWWIIMKNLHICTRFIIYCCLVSSVLCRCCTDDAAIVLYIDSYPHASMTGSKWEFSIPLFALPCCHCSAMLW